MPSIHIRLSAAQHAELTQDASANSRSLQREVVHRLFPPQVGEGAVRAVREFGDALQKLGQDEPELPAVSSANAARVMSELAEAGPTPAVVSTWVESAKAAPLKAHAADPKNKATQAHAPKQKSGAGPALCPHRVPIGTYCKRCHDEQHH